MQCVKSDILISIQHHSSGTVTQKVLMPEDQVDRQATSILSKMSAIAMLFHFWLQNEKPCQGRVNKQVEKTTAVNVYQLAKMNLGFDKMYSLITAQFFQIVTNKTDSQLASPHSDLP